MTTAINLTDQELAELREATNEQDAAAALRLAVKEYVRYIKRMRLKQMAGRIDMQDNWQQLEQAEIREQ